MKLKPGTPTLAARLLQRQLRKLGIRYGYRKGLRELGPIGLWVACLSNARNMDEAVGLYKAMAESLAKRG